MTNRQALPSAEALDQMSMVDFVSAWRSLVGEAPAVMLESRAEMICILTEAIRALPVCADEQAHFREAKLTKAALRRAVEHRKLTVIYDDLDF